MICQKILRIVVGSLITYGKLRRVSIEDHVPNDIRYEGVSFRSRDGMAILEGWYFSSSGNERHIVLAPGGLTGHRNSDLKYILIPQELVRAGYNVLSFDYREYCGHSFSSLGITQAQDLLGALDWLRSKGWPLSQIGIFGRSIGAVAALYSATIEKEISAIVAECPWADSKNLWSWKEGKKTNPAKVLALVLYPCLKKSNWGIVNPTELIDRVQARICFICGEKDELVSSANIQKLARPLDEVWIVPQSGHWQIHKSSDYIRTIITFFNNNLGGIS